MRDIKTTSIAIGGAITTIVAFILKLRGVEIPTEVIASIGTLTAVLVGIFAKDAERHVEPSIDMIQVPIAEKAPQVKD